MIFFSFTQPGEEVGCRSKQGRPVYGSCHVQVVLRPGAGDPSLANKPIKVSCEQGCGLSCITLAQLGNLWVDLDQKQDGKSYGWEAWKSRVSFQVASLLVATSNLPLLLLPLQLLLKDRPESLPEISSSHLISPFPSIVGEAGSSPCVSGSWAAT